MNTGTIERCLCQDCLCETAAVFDSNCEAECTHCGGDLCSCADCMDTLNALIAGQRNPVELGLLAPVTSWSRCGVRA